KPPVKRPPPNCTTVWQIDQQGIEGIHPTEKPLEIITRPIEYHTEPGEVIYEPFAGSGTALAAAETTGRVCCRIEKAEAIVAGAAGTDGPGTEVERWHTPAVDRRH